MIKKVNETRLWSASDIRKLCICHRWFDFGNDDDFEEMLKYVNDNDPSNENIFKVSEFIYGYTKPKRNLTIDVIMTIIMNNAVTILLYI